jgi:preprotein translocase subunit SecF
MRIFTNPDYNFIRWRWHALIASVVIIGAGLTTVASRGLPLGIDFTGGTAIVIRFAQPVDTGRVRAALGSVASEIVVQPYGPAADNQILIRLPPFAQQGEGAALDEGSRRVEEALRAGNLGSFEILSKDIVGPVIGQDLQRKGIFATVFALGGILLYITFRFRFTFGVGAIVATFHDVLVTLVLLVWFNYDLTLNVIAAILTITGYSVNDTIVVFDRVRENQRLMRREPLEKIVNKSVNQTLARTIITAGTTFLAVLSLFIFGGEVLRGFAFTMVVGIVTGTYSTVFIASAIAIILSRRTPTQGAVQTQPAQRRA